METKFVDGIPVPPDYQAAVSNFIAAAVRAEELVPQGKLEAYAALSDYERWIRERWGYSEEVEIHGSMGWTELGLHTRKYDTPAVKALCRPGNYYFAYVLLEDGSWISGCFHRFADGTFSLS